MKKLQLFVIFWAVVGLIVPPGISWAGRTYSSSGAKISAPKISAPRASAPRISTPRVTRTHPAPKIGSGHHSAGQKRASGHFAHRGHQGLRQFYWVSHRTYWVPVMFNGYTYIFYPNGWVFIVDPATDQWEWDYPEGESLQTPSGYAQNQGASILDAPPPGWVEPVPDRFPAHHGER